MMMTRKSDESPFLSRPQGGPSLRRGVAFSRSLATHENRTCLPARCAIPPVVP